MTLDLYDQVRRDFDRHFGVRRDDEQQAPLTQPTQEEVDRIREALEERKRRLREATPLSRAVTHDGGSEL